MNKKVLVFVMTMCMTVILTVCALGESMTLSFVGDCSPGSNFGAQKTKTSYAGVVDENGYEWPFSLVSEYLKADDFTFANCEIVFSTRKRHQDKRFNLVAEPEYAQVFVNSGVDALGIANNHTMDFYVEGYEDTVNALETYNIPYFGSMFPDSKREKEQIAVFDVKGVKIGAIGFTYPLDDYRLKSIKKRIALLKEEEKCDLVMVSLHWGKEEQPYPDSWQFPYARKIIDAGADIIWGQHPHILQQVMFYKGKPIMFSTGNFTFGCMKKVDPDTGIFQLTYDLEDGKADLESFSVIPCRTQGSGDYRPYPLTDEDEKQKMLKKLVYKRTVKNMEALPEEFIHTGIVHFEDGKMIPLESAQ